VLVVVVVVVVLVVLMATTMILTATTITISRVKHTAFTHMSLTISCCHCNHISTMMWSCRGSERIAS
jgi:hypothetical protein